MQIHNWASFSSTFSIYPSIRGQIRAIHQTKYENCAPPAGRQQQREWHGWRGSSKLQSASALLATNRKLVDVEQSAYKTIANRTSQLNGLGNIARVEYLITLRRHYHHRSSVFAEEFDALRDLTLIDAAPAIKARNLLAPNMSPSARQCPYYYNAITSIRSVGAFLLLHFFKCKLNIYDFPTRRNIF